MQTYDMHIHFQIMSMFGSRVTLQQRWLTEICQPAKVIAEIL